MPFLFKIIIWNYVIKTKDNYIITMPFFLTFIVLLWFMISNLALSRIYRKKYPAPDYPSGYLISSWIRRNKPGYPAMIFGHQLSVRIPYLTSGRIPDRKRPDIRSIPSIFQPEDSSMLANKENIFDKDSCKIVNY